MLDTLRSPGWMRLVATVMVAAAASLSFPFSLFTYDYDGKVTGISYPGSVSDSFGYNGLGARTSTSGTNGSRTFLRNGHSVTASVLSDGTADYTPGISRTQSSTTTFAHAGLKNTSTQSAENETVAATKVYDAFGNTVSSSGSWSGPFAYAGNFGYQTDASGLKLLGHRYYEPSIGRFITLDPIGDGRNWYSYVGNSPVARADSSGLAAHLIVVLIVIIISGGVAEAPTGNETAADLQRHRYEAAATNLEIASFLVPVPPVVKLIKGARASLLASKTTAGVTAHIDDSGIIIGEGWDRVKDAAGHFGLEHMPEITVNLGQYADRELWRQSQAWLMKEAIENGRKVFSIGRDAGRIKAPSRIFTAEEMFLRKNGIEPITLPW